MIFPPAFVAARGAAAPGSAAGFSRGPGPAALGPRRAARGLRGGVGGAEGIARGAQISPLTAALSFGHGRLYCVITDNNYNRSVVRDTGWLINATVTGGRDAS